MFPKFDETDSYHVRIFGRIMTLLPYVGLCAALVFTGARLMGFFAYAAMPPLIGFDTACISYFAVAHILKRRGIVKDGRVDMHRINAANAAICFILILQWNLISYIFPTRDFWGYAPMFLLLLSFMFRRAAVLWGIVGLSVSIAVSWLLRGGPSSAGQGRAFYGESDPAHRGARYQLHDDLSSDLLFRKIYRAGQGKRKGAAAAEPGARENGAGDH